MEVLTMPIHQKLLSMAAVGLVSPMKMWMSPIGTMKMRDGSALAVIERLSCRTMGKATS
jgi:hypothetical protein